MPNPIGSEIGAETVTLLNTNAAALNLDAFSLRDPAGGRMMLSGMLGAGEAVRIKLTAPCGSPTPVIRFACSRAKP